MPSDFHVPTGGSGPVAATEPDQVRERLIRLLRESDSATRTLAAWTGHPVHLDLLCRRDDHLTVAEFADLDVRHPEPVQRREVRLIDLHDRALSEASATVLMGRVPEHTASALRESDVPLGLLLSPMHARRHTLSVVRRESSADGDRSVSFEISARLDIAGRPVALVHERYLRAVLS